MSTRDAGQVRGFTATDTSARTDLEFKQGTVQPAGSSRAALDVLANLCAQLIATDAVEASSTTSVINATAHVAKVGDIVVFSSGALDTQAFTVYAVDTNTITLAQTTSAAPSAADTFRILRFSYPVINSAGALSVTVSSGSITADTELPAAAALADNTSNPTTTSVGTFPHVYDGATWDRMRGDSTDGTLVNLGANNDVTVTGTVTANAGTNLNTSALALESGGNLAASATSLAAIDDWDESDRAKVNPIVGQAGVAAGSGVVGVTTQRVVLATDVALPAGTNVIGHVIADSGSTTAVTQATGTNLHAVLDSGTLTTCSTVTNLAQMNGAAITMGNGVSGTGVQRVTIASDSTGTVAATQSGTWNVTNVSGTVSLPTGAASAANQTTEITSLQLIDDIVHSGDASLSKYAAIGAVFDDASIGTVTENNAMSLRMSSRRQLYVEGGVASDIAIAANPLTTGGRADSGEPTAVSTSGDAVNLLADLVGKLVVAPYAVPQRYKVAFKVQTGATGATDYEVVASAASTKYYITSMAGSTNGSAGTYTLRDGTNSVWRMWMPNTSNFQIDFPSPIPITAGNAINFQFSAGSDITCAITYVSSAI